MAIRVLLDHGVRQDHIIFITFLVARGGGISVLHHAFPFVKVVCGAVDEELREAWLDGYENDGQSESEKRKCWVIEPGMGQIGKEYDHVCSDINSICCRRSLLPIGNLWFSHVQHEP